MFGIEATTKPLIEKPVFGTQSPRLLLTPFTLEPPTMRPDPWSPLRLFDNLPPLPTFEPFGKKLASNTTAPTHVGKPPPLPTFQPFGKKLAPNTTAPPHVGKPPPLPTLEPFDKKLASNTTASPHVHKPPPLPTLEPFDKKLASNTTASRSRYFNKLLDLVTFNPDSKKLASNTSLFHFTPFKPVNDWKPFKMPDFKPKLDARTPAPATVAVHTSGVLVIAKAIAGLSGCILIMILICCCIFSKRINRTRRERRPRRNAGLPSWYYGSDPIDMGDDPPRYSYTNPEDTESQNYKQEIDVGVALEMGTELSLDLNSYDNDTGGASNDYVQD